MHTIFNFPRSFVRLFFIVLRQLCLLHQVGALFIEANLNGIFFHGFTESKAKLVDGYNSWDNKFTVLTVHTPQGSISEIWGWSCHANKKADLLIVIGGSLLTSLFTFCSFAYGFTCRRKHVSQI